MAVVAMDRWRRAHFAPAEYLGVGFPQIAMSVKKPLPFWLGHPPVCDAARWARSRNASYDKNASNHHCAAHNGQQTRGRPDTDAHAKTCVSTDGCGQVCTHTHTQQMDEHRYRQRQHTHTDTDAHTLGSPSHIVFHSPTELHLKSLVW